MLREKERWMIYKMVIIGFADDEYECARFEIVARRFKMASYYSGTVTVAVLPRRSLKPYSFSGRRMETP